MQKTVIYKVSNKNLDRFKSAYHCNLIPFILVNSMHRGDVTEAQKSLLTDGSSLILSNEFNVLINNLDKFLCSKGDKSLLQETFDRISTKRHAKCNGKISKNKTSVSATRMMQQCLTLPNTEA